MEKLVDFIKLALHTVATFAGGIYTGVMAFIKAHPVLSGLTVLVMLMLNPALLFFAGFALFVLRLLSKLV